MSEQGHGFFPDWASHPGQTLAEYFSFHGWTYGDAEAQIGVCGYLLKAVCDGEAPVDAALAKDLARAELGSEQFWLNRQAHYEAALARGAKRI